LNPDPINSPRLHRRLSSPALFLAGGWAVSAAIWFLPAGYTAAVKGCVGAALRPAQVGLLTARAGVASIASQIEMHGNTVQRLAKSEADRLRLEEENRRLAAELALLRSRTAEGEHRQSDARLLVAGCIPARVLGRQARDFLAGDGILDVGSRAGVRGEALVVGGPKSFLDQGANRRLESEELVLAQGRVWGKIVEVGPQTSTVRTPCEPGFRDLVRLGVASADGRPPRLGPQGLLEGTGEPLARVRRVDVTEPVAVGDAVYTASGQGVLPAPLLYGFVVRVQRPVGAAHWEIWMKPALDCEPESVVVLRTEINPARIDPGPQINPARVVR
jgi:cell shape-determining protein MreC